MVDMTRDEAIEKLRTAQPGMGASRNAVLWIDALIALGVFKLEEPEPDIVRALDAAGLQITEKQGQ
jgi:hypothetical protein